LAMSKPTVVIFMVDGSFSSLHSTARAWHIDAVRGRPPHQISSNRLKARRRKSGNQMKLVSEQYRAVVSFMAGGRVFVLLG